MGIGDYILSGVTPKADEINLIAFTSTTPMPPIRYFVAAYDTDAEINDDDGYFRGMKTPWFSRSYPDGAAPDDYKEYDPLELRNIPLYESDGSPKTFDSAEEAETHANDNGIVNPLKYTDPETSQVQILCCDIPTENVTQSPQSDGQPATVKIKFGKNADEHNHNYLGNPWSLANVFYILDAECNILSVIHGRGFNFRNGNTWTITQHLVYQRDIPVDGIVNDNSPFSRDVSDIILPEVIVGGAADVISRKASNNMTHLTDSTSESYLTNESLTNKRVVLLKTADALNITSAVRGGDNVHFNMENPSAALDLNNHSLELSGDGLRGYLRIKNIASGGLTISGDNADLTLDINILASGGLTVSGTNAKLRLNISEAEADGLAVSANGVNLEISSDNQDVLDFQETATGICLVNGRIHSRGDIDIINGDLEVNGDITSTAEINVNSLEVSDATVVDSGGNINAAAIQASGDISAAGDVVGTSLKVGETTIINLDADGETVVNAGNIAADEITVSGAATVNGLLEAKGGLSGDQGNIDLKGNSLVNCRTISELFQGGCARFNGTDHYAQIPDNSDLNFSGDFSLMLAFKTNKDYNGGQARLLNKGQDSDNAYYRIYMNANNDLAAAIKVGDSTVVVQCDDHPVNDDHIHAVLLRCERGGYLTLYLDGISASSEDISSLVGDIANSQDLFLCKNGEETAGDYFQGEMFLVRVWNRLLTVDESIEYSGNPTRELNPDDIDDNSCALELSVQGLGEADRWLNSVGDQLHADLDAEVVKNLTHAGDLEVTEDLTVGGALNAGDLNLQEFMLRNLSLNPLLSEVIVGDQTDKDDNKANYLLSELPAQDLNNKKILFLETSLSQDMAIDSDDAELDMETPSAVLDLNGKSLSLSGNRLRGYLNVTDTSDDNQGKLRLLGREVALNVNMSRAADNSLEVSGKQANLEITAYSNNQTRISDATLNFQGTGVCVVNGRLMERPDDTVGEEVIVGCASDLVAGRADYDINLCAADAPDFTDKQVRFLKTIGTLTADPTFKGDNITFIMEHTDAFLDLSGHTLTLPGENLRGYLNVDNPATAALEISGDGPEMNVNMTNAADGALKLSGTDVNMIVTATDVNGDLFITTTDADGDLYNAALDFPDTSRGICVINGTKIWYRAWQTLGDTGSSDGSYSSLVISGGEVPYIFGDGVKKFETNTATWSLLGNNSPSTSQNGTGDLAIDSYGVVYVSYNIDGKLYVKKYNNSWETLKNLNDDHVALNGGNSRLAIDSDKMPCVAYKTDSNRKIIVKKYNGLTTTWDDVGVNGLASAESANQLYNMDFVIPPDSDFYYLSYRNLGPPATIIARKYSKEDEVWTSTLDTTGNRPKTAVTSSMFYLKYQEDEYDDSTGYNTTRNILRKYNGSIWSDITEIPFNNTNNVLMDFAVDADGVLYVLYIDGEMFKYKEQQWSQVGGKATDDLGAPLYMDLCISPDGIPYVSYNNSSNKHVVKKYDYETT